MGNILDRYIVKSFLVNYAISLAVLISMYVVLDLFVNFDEFTERGRPATEVAMNIISFYGYRVPLYFGQLSGVITAFAATCTLARMQRNNELTAVLASGTSLYRVAVPVVVAGVAMNMLLFADQEFVIPEIAHKLARPHDDVDGSRTYDVWFVRDKNRAMVSAVGFIPGNTPDDAVLYRMMVIFTDENRRLTEMIRADWAQYDWENRQWILEQGKRMRPGTGGLGANNAASEPVEVYPSELTPNHLMLRQAAQWLHLVRVRDLDRLLEQPGQAKLPILRVKHLRFTQPFVNMLMLLLGIPFFLNREPGRVVVSGGLCLLVCGLCFVVAFVGQNLLTSTSLPPAFPAWLPIMVFGPVAVWLLDSIKT